MASSSWSSSHLSRSSRSSVWICVALVALLFVSASSAEEETAAESASEGEVPSSTSSNVLTLDASNFDETVAKHSFIVVEFYAPWCGFCKQLEPEYEKAATVLSKHDPPIVLAKVDADDEKNKEVASKYELEGFPTIKILRNKGQNVQEYNGPREADGIVEYLKKQSGPPSVVIKSTDDANGIIDSKKIFIVGVFPEFSGKEFENFIAVAEKLRSDYDFGHTLEAKFLPKGESAVSGPLVRLLKPFDEPFVDTKDFDVDALEEFVEGSSRPLVTIYDNDPNNQPFVLKFFSGTKPKAMLFVGFNDGKIDKFKSEYRKAAEFYKKEDMKFLLGDLNVSESALQFFGLKEDQAPLIVIQTSNNKKYLKTNLEPLQIMSWIKEYMDGNLKPFTRSEPIPDVNNEPVKVVVADSINDVVLNSGKNVFLEFYAPWCGHCQKLAPILDEVAISFQGDPDVIVAKLDASANDFPNEFDVEGYPTMYFSSASGKLVLYEGDRTKEDIIDFIHKNRDVLKEAVQSDSMKDEL